MSILLLRHGHIHRPTARTYIGQLDLPLSGKGRQQALNWANTLASMGVTKVYASDLQRAYTFGQPIAERVGCPLLIDSRWREVFLGDWEGRLMDEVRQESPALYAARGAAPDRVRPPKGEHFQDMLERVLPAFTALQSTDHPSGLTVVVTHAGVIRALRCNMEGLPLKDMFTLDVPLAGAWSVPGDSRVSVVREY